MQFLASVSQRTFYKLRWDIIVLQSRCNVMLQTQDFVNIKSLITGDVSNGNTNQTVHVS